MTIKEKIQTYRKAYVNKYGKSPTSVILGYEIIGEMKRETPSRFVAPGAELYGMKIIVDNDRPTRVEAGDFET